MRLSGSNDHSAISVCVTYEVERGRPRTDLAFPLLTNVVVPPKLATDQSQGGYSTLQSVRPQPLTCRRASRLAGFVLEADVVGTLESVKVFLRRNAGVRSRGIAHGLGRRS